MFEAERVTIVGTGLLGASIALALRARGFRGRIVGVARRRETAERALQKGGFDAVETDLAAAASGSDFLIVAVPLGQFEAVFEAVAPHVGPGCVVTDVGSTKGNVLRAARRWLRTPAMFVGSHPMAGSEQQGPEAATATLFDGKPCVVTPEADTDPGALAKVESLWRLLGMALLHMDATAHDEQAATISHVPHLASVMLVRVAMRRGGWDLASTGFRDTTRLASSNPPMRADILAANREAVARALRELRAECDAILETLDAGGRGTLLEMLEEAKGARDAWIASRANGGEREGV